MHENLSIFFLSPFRQSPPFKGWFWLRHSACHLRDCGYGAVSCTGFFGSLLTPYFQIGSDSLLVSEPVREITFPSVPGRLLEHRPRRTTLSQLMGLAVLTGLPWIRKTLRWSPPAWCALPGWGAPFLQCVSPLPPCWSVAACHHTRLGKGRQECEQRAPSGLQVPGSCYKKSREEGCPKNQLKVSWMR